MSRLAKMLPAFYFIVDISIIIFSFQFSRFLFGFRNFPLLTAISLLLIISIWSITGYFTRLYRENLHNGVWARMKGYFKIYLFFAILIVIAGILAEMSYPSALSLIFISIFVGTNIVVNFLLVSIISHFRRRKGNIKNTLIIGIGKSALKISNYLQANPDFGFKIGAYLEYGNEICKVDKTLTLERTT